MGIIKVYKKYTDAATYMSHGYPTITDYTVIVDNTTVAFDGSGAPNSSPITNRFGASYLTTSGEMK